MIEALLKNRLCNDSKLTSMLGTYKGKPALFYQKVPSDMDRGWSKPEYPRIDYNINMRERDGTTVGGVVTLNVWCSEESGYMSEDICPCVVDLLQECFCTVGDRSFCVLWDNTDAFTYARKLSGIQKDRNTPNVFGTAILFNIRSFAHESGCQIAALNKWTKARFPNAKMIGEDSLAEVWQANKGEPAVVWRMESLDGDDKNSYAATWFSCNIAGHVIGNDQLAFSIAEGLTACGELIFDDGRPMFIKSVSVNGKDRLNDGQILIKGVYGVKRKTEAVEKLNYVSFRSDNA